MKVVIFCGGLGMRLREYAENVPKPMVPVGYRPILWHLMKYYAHFGHRDFILCLGYRADAVKEYFLKYDECLNNDFVLSQGGKQLELYNWDIRDWRITFAETGINSNLGQRLRAVQKYLAGERMFLANYVDGLTDLHLPDLIEFAQAHNKVATFVSVRPSLSFHLVSANHEGLVENISEMSRTDLRVNGGFFAFRQEIFDYIQEGEELVHEPFQRLIREKRLLAYPYNGFFASMDTFKDKQLLDDLCAAGKAPWQVWRDTPTGDGAASGAVKDTASASETIRVGVAD